MSERDGSHGSLAHAPRAGRQIVLLLGLWWRHMRRRAVRIGEAPKLSGVPGFLLINVISVGYMAPAIWRAVSGSMAAHEGFFAWHMLGVLLVAFGGGATKAAGALQLRGMRNDGFLEALPLMPVATLSLQLIDGVVLILLALVVPLAALHTHGPLGISSILPTLLGAFAYVVFFVLAHAVVAWARALGPASFARRAAYVGVGLNLIGLFSAMMPIGQFTKLRGIGASQLVTTWWLGGQITVCGLYAGFLLLLIAAYRALLAAERFGFDRLAIQGRAPKALKGVQSRVSLEWQMMWRQGGKATIVVFSLALCGLAWLLWGARGERLLPRLGLYALGFAVYLGTIQTLGQAGRAARSDLMARPFLSTLPLSPHQVLDGKARALRILIIPVFAMLALIGGLGAWHGEGDLAYRALLALASLYVIIDGAIGIAFLSSGVGVIGIAGGQASSSFSTQLLMMPLFATVLAGNVWTASVSFIAVLAVTSETRRAAKLSVRWLDDADDGVERETTVWRALLAATAFFAMQVFSARLLDLFDVPPGYMLATAFGVAALVLVLLTRRNSTRFEAPRFMPQRFWYWPLGIVAGAGSGALALALAKVLPPVVDAQLETQAFSGGELIAIFVTMVGMAPLAEEYFFRGWLQKAIEKDLPAARKRWAFALGALAFALAHIGSYGVPQLVLGLLAGALYAFGGGLWPAILAHATHNAVVLLTAQ